MPPPAADRCIWSAWTGEDARPYTNLSKIDDMLQFADIAGPVIVHQDLHRLGIDSLDRFAGFSGKARDEQVHEIGNIFLAFAERSYIDRHHVEAVVKIFAKRALFECRAQIA